MDRERALRDRFRRLMVAQGVFNRVVRPCGVALSLPHAHALLELYSSSEPMTVTELATSLQIDRTNVSRLCQRMEELEELKRVQGSRDRRARMLQLTERGEALAAHVDRSSTTHFGAVVEILGEATEEVLVALAKLEQAFRDVSQTNEKGENHES